MTADDLVERELMYSRFQQLLRELLRGSTMRTVFQPWEMRLLLDIESCVIDAKQRVGILRQYDRAVRRQLETEPGPPMLLSEFLQWRRTRRPSIE